MEKKCLSLKPTIKMVTFQHNFVWEVSLNGNVYDFSLDYNSIDTSDVLNISKYLMTNNNIK